jgi:hypothetical protein
MCGVDTGATTVSVIQLPQGQRVGSAPAAATPGPESHTAVTALVLRASGAAAWIAQSASLGNHGRSTQVRSLVRGQVSVLDQGAGIGPRSLRLHGRQLSWRNGGRQRTAQLG